MLKPATRSLSVN